MAFDLYLGLTIDIILFCFGKYLYFGQTSTSSSYQQDSFNYLLPWTNNQQKLPFWGLFQDSKSLFVSGIVLILFNELPSQLDLPAFMRQKYSLAGTL